MRPFVDVYFVLLLNKGMESQLFPLQAFSFRGRFLVTCKTHGSIMVISSLQVHHSWNPSLLPSRGRILHRFYLKQKQQSCFISLNLLCFFSCLLVSSILIQELKPILLQDTQIDVFVEVSLWL